MSKKWYKTPNGTLVYVGADANEIDADTACVAHFADGRRCGRFSASVILVNWTPCDPPEPEVEAGQVRVDSWGAPQLIAAVIGGDVIHCWREFGKLCIGLKKLDTVRKWPLHDDQEGERKRIMGE